MKIRTGDSVVIITGKDKGRQGRVLRILPNIGRVVVEGANMRKKHIKKTPQQPGQRITYEASIHVSNVMVLDPKTKKPTRIGYTVDGKTGKKVRFAKKSKEIIAGAARTTKAASTKKAAPKKSDEKQGKEQQTEVAKTPVQKPTKQPFWKRGFTGEGGGKSGGATGGGAESKAMPSAHRSQGG